MSGRTLAWVLIAVLAIALGLQIDRARDRYQASRLLAAAKGVTIQASQAGRLSPQLLAQSLRLLDRARRLDPIDAKIPIARGAIHRLAGRDQAALRAYREAAELEPRAEIYANIARIELDLGNRDAALEAMRLAVLLDHTMSREFRNHLRADEERE